MKSSFNWSKDKRGNYIARLNDVFKLKFTVAKNEAGKWIWLSDGRMADDEEVGETYQFQGQSEKQFDYPDNAMDDAEKAYIKNYESLLSHWHKNEAKAKKVKNPSKKSRSKKRKVVVYYQTVTHESAEHGDFADEGFHDELIVEPDKYDLEDGKTAVSIAANFIRDAGGSVEASSSHPGRNWYTTVDPEIDYRTGERTFYTFHPENFSEFEEAQIYRALMGKKERNPVSKIAIDLIFENDFNGKAAKFASEHPIAFKGLVKSANADIMYGGLNDFSIFVVGKTKKIIFLDTPQHGWFLDESGKLIGEEDGGLTGSWKKYESELVKKLRRNPVDDKDHDLYVYLEKHHVFWQRAKNGNILILTQGYKTHHEHGHYGLEKVMRDHGYYMVNEEFDRMSGQTIGEYKKRTKKNPGLKRKAKKVHVLKKDQPKVSAKISKLIREGMPMKQAVAVALSMYQSKSLGPRGGYKRHARKHK